MRRKDTNKKGNNKENPCFFDEKRKTLTPVSAQKGEHEGEQKGEHKQKILRRTYST